MDNGSVIVGITAVQIWPSTAVLRQGFQVKAAAGNTGTVFIGNSSIVTPGTVPATDGFELSAGQGLFIPATNSNSFYAIASAAAQKVFFVGV